MQDRGPTVLAVVIVLMCVSTAFIVLRLISRLGIVKRISNDDYAIILAWVRHRIPNESRIWRTNWWQFIAFGFSVSICYGTTVGLGRHEADISPLHHSPLKKAEYAFSVLYVGAGSECLPNLG